jgi:hypothetical protein
MEPFATTPSLEPPPIHTPASLISTAATETAPGPSHPRRRHQFLGLAAVAAVFLAAAVTFAGLWHGARNDADRLGADLVARDLYVAELESKAAELGRQLKLAQDEVSAMTKEVAVAKEHARNLQADLDEALDELAQAQTALKQAQQEVESQKKRADAAERERDRQQRRADEAERALADAKQALADATSSWIQTWATSAYIDDQHIARESLVCFMDSITADVGLADAIAWFNSPDDGTPPSPDMVRAILRALEQCGIDPTAFGDQ